MVTRQAILTSVLNAAYEIESSLLIALIKYWNVSFLTWMASFASCAGGFSPVLNASVNSAIPSSNASISIETVCHEISPRSAAAIHVA